MHKQSQGLHGEFLSFYKIPLKAANFCKNDNHLKAYDLYFQNSYIKILKN